MENWDENFYEKHVDDKFRGMQFVFTSFNDAPPVFTKQMRGLMYAPEVAPTTGKKHWQGWVWWKSQHTIGQTYTALNNSWCSPARATYKQNRDYIEGPYKNGNKTKPINTEFVQFGDAPEQGKRTDLLQIKDDLQTGKRKLHEILLEEPMIYHQYGRTLDKLDDELKSELYRGMTAKIEWYLGQNLDHMSHAYYLPKDGWFDRYRQEKTVVIENITNISCVTLLNLARDFHAKVPRRAREPTPFMADRIIIFSESLPWQVWSDFNDVVQLLKYTTIISDHVWNATDIVTRFASFTSDSALETDIDYRKTIIERQLSL